MRQKSSFRARKYCETYPSILLDPINSTICKINTLHLYNMSQNIRKTVSNTRPLLQTRHTTIRLIKGLPTVYHYWRRFFRSIRTKNNSVVQVNLCLFTSVKTRAVHLKIIDDLTGQTFILAFRRFTSRRSLPKAMISDNCTTYT